MAKETPAQRLETSLYWETIECAVDAHSFFHNADLVARCRFHRPSPPFPTSFLAIRVNSIVVLRNVSHHNINKTYASATVQLVQVDVGLSDVGLGPISTRPRHQSCRQRTPRPSLCRSLPCRKLRYLSRPRPKWCSPKATRSCSARTGSST